MKSKKAILFALGLAVIVLLVGVVAASKSVDYEDVLLGTAGFLYISEGTARPQTISDVPALFDPYDDYMKIWTFAVQDLDGDGNTEVILSVQGISGDTSGSLILHQISNKVYGYSVRNREFFELKADGSFSYTDPTAADEGGTSSISGFTETSYTVEKVTRGSGSYPDAVWHEFTEENIKSVF